MHPQKCQQHAPMPKALRARLQGSASGGADPETCKALHVALQSQDGQRQCACLRVSCSVPFRQHDQPPGKPAVAVQHSPPSGAMAWTQTGNTIATQAPACGHQQGREHELTCVPLRSYQSSRRLGCRSSGLLGGQGSCLPAPEQQLHHADTRPEACCTVLHVQKLQC